MQYLPQLGSLLLTFLDNTAVALPVSNYSDLSVLDERDMQAFSLEMGGSVLCLKDKDLHVSIAGLICASKPLMDMAASLVAIQSSRKVSTTKSAA